MSKRPRYRGARTHRRNPMRILLPIVILAVILVAAGIFIYARRYSPSKEKVNLNDYYGLQTSDEMYIIKNGTQAGTNGYLEGDEGYVPISEVQSGINGRFFWDPTEKVIRYVDGNNIISAAADTKTYTVNKAQKTAKYKIVEIRDDTAYLSLSFVKKYTNIRISYFKKPNRVVLSDQWGKVKYRTVKRKTQIRAKGGYKSGVVAEVERGTKVTVQETYENWSAVCTEDGTVGYIQNRMLGSETTETFTSKFKAAEHAHITRTEPVNLVWHQVTNTSANSRIDDVLKKSPGINVVSPTWFYLNDSKGGIQSYASASYAAACHKQNVQVWALVSNLENSSVDTAKVLNTTSSRDQLINNLVAQAIAANIDGINVDFEALKNSVGYGFIEFIRELSVKCSNNGLVLSVDNYPPSAYTGVYYRSEEAKFADFVILMAYDEHFKGSEAGSVSSLSYVEDSVTAMLKDVPADQLVLGLPFYTRLWETKGSGTPSCTTYGMEGARKLLKSVGVSAEWDDRTSQNYATYQKDGSTYQIWLEDARSLQTKLKVMQTKKLAGAAFWKSGYETSDVWSVISKYTAS